MTEHTPGEPPRRRPGLRLATIVVSLVLVLGAAGFVAWEFWGTAVVARAKAQERAAELRARWDFTTPQERSQVPRLVVNPGSGEPQWLMRIPELWGEDTWPVVVGVAADDLTGGIGWYPGTAQPGQPGNFGVTGYCLTRGEPFRQLRELPVGAEVIVETADATFTYELMSSAASLTVQQDDSWVLDPVPGRPDETPSQALMTLTTCEDLYPTSERSVAFGVLKTTELK
ncbi:MAG: class E sortase [Propionibacteriaceae bacterium]|nr:class E sortase [Propionibacteriaceae bacterium]